MCHYIAGLALDQWRYFGIHFEIIIVRRQLQTLIMVVCGFCPRLSATSHSPCNEQNYGIDDISCFHLADSIL